MYTKRDGIEIDKLRYKIKVAAIPDSPPGTIRIFNEKTLEFSKIPLCNGSLSDIKKIVKVFIFELAVLIWHHKNKADNIYNDMVSSIRQSNLSTVRQFLEGLEYSPKSIGKCIEILGHDLDRRLATLEEPPNGQSHDLVSDAGGYAIAIENEVISKIRSAYKKYTGLTFDQHIIPSMAIVFESVDFWQPGEGMNERQRIKSYIECLKGRIKQVDEKTKTLSNVSAT